MAYVGNIETETNNNPHFRRVLYTAPNCQLVVMHLLPNEDIGEETHDTVDQFIRIETGSGVAVIEGQETPIAEGFALVIPAGTKHNVKNTSADTPMKLYTVYAPPHHRDGTVHESKADAAADLADEYTPG